MITKCQCQIIAFVSSLTLITDLSPVEAGDISVGQVNGRGVFIQNGQIVDLRGVNYDILVPNVGSLPAGYYHGLFDPCNGTQNSYPTCYGDGSQAEAAIRYIHSSGYNYIRVFLSSNYVNEGFTYTATPSTANVIPSEYWFDVADFLQRASNNGMRVILTSEYVPANFHYANLTCADAGTTLDPCSTGENDVLFNPSWASAYASFLSTLLSDLYYQQVWPNAFSAIMAIDVKNELSVRSDQLPLSNTSLTELQIDNSVYNMADYSYEAGSRQVLIDDLTKNFALTMGSAIRQADPTRSILVGISVAPPAAFGQANAYGGANGPTTCSGSDTMSCIFPVRHEILALYGQVDYSDIHVYPQNNNNPYNEDQALQSADFVYGGFESKPIMMGEFGALRTGGNNWPSAQAAANGLQAHVAESCDYGFSGWGLWTWSTQNYDEPYQWWSAIILNADGSQNSSAINGALAPAAWSPPC